MGNRASLVFAFLIQSCIVILFAVTASMLLPLLIGDVCLFGFAMGLTVSFPMTILAELAELFPEERAAAIGVYILVRYLCMTAGSVMGSWVYSAVDLKPLFLTCGLSFLVLVAAGGVWINLKRTTAQSSSMI